MIVWRTSTARDADDADLRTRIKGRDQNSMNRTKISRPVLVFV